MFLPNAKVYVRDTFLSGIPLQVTTIKNLMDTLQSGRQMSILTPAGLKQVKAIKKAKQSSVIELNLKTLENQKHKILASQSQIFKDFNNSTLARTMDLSDTSAILYVYEVANLCIGLTPKYKPLIFDFREFKSISSTYTLELADGSNDVYIDSLECVLR